jgi:putative endonuclease
VSAAGGAASGAPPDCGDAAGTGAGTATAQGRATQRQLIGAAAESLAAQHLEAAGLTVLARNYRCRMGELDLVARDGEVLVIAEVRLRRSAQFGGAAASITWQKRRRIVRATRHLLAREPALQRLRVRFDALVVEGEGAIQWFKGAFDAR